MVKAMLDCLAQTVNSIGIFDEIITIEITQFDMGIVGLDASLDVSGDGGALTCCLHDVEYGVTHRQAYLWCGTIGVYGFS